MAKQDANIVLFGRRSDRLMAKAQWVCKALSKAQLEHRSADITLLAMDFTDLTSVGEATAPANRRFPAINGLVLSVGVLIQDGPTILPDDREAIVATNVSDRP